MAKVKPNNDAPVLTEGGPLTLEELKDLMYD